VADIIGIATNSALIEIFTAKFTGSRIYRRSGILSCYTFFLTVSFLI
jgi:hypothetical protein